MSNPLTLDGPTFWRENYGIENRKEFDATVQKFLPSVLPFGNLGTDNVALAAGYQLPYGQTGLLFQAGLKLEGYSGPEKASGSTILALQQQGALHNVQEIAMGTLIIPNCFQVAIEGVVAGKPIVNVIGLQNAGGTAAGAAAATAAAWESATGPLKQLSSGYAMVNYHAVDIGSSTGGIVDLASVATGGAGAGSFATRGACALVKWNGSSRSRSTRGRLYFGPLQEGNVNADGATLAAGAVTVFATTFAAFRTSLAGAGYPLVVLSRTLNTAFPVTSSSIEGTIATQRRRIRS